MLRPRPRTAARLVTGAAVAVLASLGWASAASAHTGGANCHGELVELGTTYENSCVFPFQGFPIGVAGIYDAGDPDKPAEIHVEVLALVVGGFPRAIGVECLQDGVTGVARCTRSHNPLTAPITAVEPVPAAITSLKCSAHSHARYSRHSPPSGKFACWSTDEARADLVADGVMGEDGF